MKKLIKHSAIVTMIFFAFVACKENKKETIVEEGYHVSGKVIGIDNGILVSGTDTTQIANGEFSLKGKLDGATNKYFNIDGKYNFPLMMANETFTVTVDINKADERGSIADIDVSGSALHDEFNKVSDHVQNTPEAKRLNELFEEGKTLEKGTDAYKKNYEEISDARGASRKVKSAYIKDYAFNNPNSAVAAFFMQLQANEVDQTFEEFEKIVEGFSDEVKKSSFYKPLKDELEALRNVAIGATAPDFTLKTDKGEDFTLSSLRGEKIVLVDFWASWCVPCRKSYPHLKKTYTKYKDKGFEVVAVTNDRDHESWKKAIKEDGTSWIQVADVFRPMSEGPPYTAQVITTYAAPYLPSTYLLDKEGKILAKHLHADELDKMLEELLVKK